MYFGRDLEHCLRSEFAVTRFSLGDWRIIVKPQGEKILFSRIMSTTQRQANVEIKTLVRVTCGEEIRTFVSVIYGEESLSCKVLIKRFVNVGCSEQMEILKLYLPLSLDPPNT